MWINSQPLFVLWMQYACVIKYGWVSRCRRSWIPSTEHDSKGTQQSKGECMWITATCLAAIPCALIGLVSFPIKQRDASSQLQLSALIPPVTWLWQALISLSKALWCIPSLPGDKCRPTNIHRICLVKYTAYVSVSGLGLILNSTWNHNWVFK